jgi:3-oxoacyl-(acyl-carrier-protein) synthase/SAM-dependent methyltransferase/acyl carrier protein
VEERLTSTNKSGVAGPAGGPSPVKQALVEIRHLRGELEEARRGQREPIAVIGVALRLPGGVASPERFWQALAEGEDLIGTIPAERWHADAYRGSGPDEPGTMYDVHGGFLDNIESFDADFFGINAREAASMDPQHRLLLELTWEALERSGIDPRSLADSPTGVWLGMTNSDYARRLTSDLLRIDGYTGIGAAASMAAGHIAYFFGLHGPAEVIDTACSSSLVAVHRAVQSLRRGETNLAIVGGANLILSPEIHVSFARTGMLSRSGRCQTFDANADGYVRSEGVAVVVLRRLSDARRAGDRVLAVIRGSAVNQDGRSAGITAPNGPAQEAVMHAALRDGDLSADSIGYVEAHGTGTPLGDPMEWRAIGAVYGEERGAGEPLHVGSVKTNLGHTEALAGLVGLIKAVLMMDRDRSIPPHLHFKSPNPRIDWERWPMKVPLTLTPWPGGSDVRRIAVSSFGFSGTNSHVILESPGTEGGPAEIRRDPDTEALLCLSASEPATLRELATRYVRFLRETQEDFHLMCESAASTRACLTHRIAVRASSKAQAADLLVRWLESDSVAPGTTGHLLAETPESSADFAQIASEFISGGKLPRSRRTPASVRVDLPLSPFQRRRFWFGESPLTEWQHALDRSWQAALAAGRTHSRLAPLGWKPESYLERWAVLERLTLAYAGATLAALPAFSQGISATLDDVIQSGEIRAIYRRLVQRWLRALVRVGHFVEVGGRYAPANGWSPIDLETCWRDAEGCLADQPGMLTYLRRSGMLLQDVLTGKVNPLETLFPDGSFTLAEAIYEEGPEAQYANRIVAEVARAFIEQRREKRTMRLLELGAGTGGTTAAILPLLRTFPVDYSFTDVSELFLNRGRRKFASFDFVRYFLLDLDSDSHGQQIRSGSFDMILAANVVHASRNIPAALERIRQLLAPGGAVVLLETTTHQACFDMSIGLIEGWQHFEDSERSEHPLLNAGKWCELLRRSGFEDPTALPDPASPAAFIGQHVLLARRGLSDVEISGSGAVAEQSHGPVPAVVNEGAEPAPAFAIDLNALSAGDWEERVAQCVRQTICRVFGLQVSPADLGDRDRLSDLGMDSLIAIELRSELAKVLGYEGRIPATIAFDTGSVGELTRTLAALTQPASESYSETGTASVPPVQVSVAVTAESLQEMTEERVEQLLKERLSKR